MFNHFLDVWYEGSKNIQHRRNILSKNLVGYSSVFQT